MLPGEPNGRSIVGKLIFITIKANFRMYQKILTIKGQKIESDLFYDQYMHKSLYSNKNRQNKQKDRK